MKVYSEEFYLEGESAKLFAEGIIDTIHEPLIILDADLRVISVNDSFYKYFEVNPSDTIGNLIYDLGNRQWDIPVLRELLEDILPLSTTIKDFEMTHNFEDIGYKTLILNARHLDIKDRISMILISINDITERKKTEAHRQKLLEKEQQFTEELRVANEELINTQGELDDTIKKLKISNKELELFAYVASHDLQEPLRMVSSFTQLLEMKYKDKLDSDANDYIQFIVEGSHRMKDLIDDLLTFSRLNKQNKKLHLRDLNQVLKNVLLNMEPTIKKENAIITKDILPIVKCDPSHRPSLPEFDL